MKVSIESAEAKFTEHLNQPENSRILFSAKFGTGKSYFLKEYFKNREDKYNIFWLTPVNYVVGANQDIFEWIKLDIAKELVKHQVFSKEGERFSNNLMLQTYLFNNSGSIITSLLTTIGDATIKAKTGVSFLKDFQKHLGEYKAFVKGTKKEMKSDEEIITDFIDSALYQKGSIYEDDIITQIIRASVELLKYKEKKENILIIDDLDRLDPEHIFRILNILSAHNDHFDTNKFGFDRVIVVGDHENIMRLYYHKYGVEADFEGYIDKFYTYEPFHFNIYDSIIHFFFNDYVIEEMNDDDLKTFIYLLGILLKSKSLRIRNLTKIAGIHNSNNHIDFGQITMHYAKTGHLMYIMQEHSSTERYTIDFNRHGIVKIIYALSLALGGLHNLKNEFQKIKDKNNYPIDPSYLDSIQRSIGIFDYISKSKMHAEGFLFREITHGGSHTTDINFKQSTRFLGLVYEIETFWDVNNKYTGGDYYALAKLVPSRIEKADTMTGNRDTALIESIYTIINFITRQRIFKNLKQ